MFIKTLTKLAIISIQRLCNRGNLHPPYNEKREKAETFSLFSQSTAVALAIWKSIAMY